MERPEGMIDVSGKERMSRRAVAETALVVPPAIVESIRLDRLPKKDALATARAAGMLAAKGTPGLIPHCHPVALTDVSVDFRFAEGEVRVRCEAAAVDRTGPEMEALCGAAIAALTLYDMVKGVCRGAEVATIRLLEKEGGKSGHWRAEEVQGEK